MGATFGTLLFTKFYGELVGNDDAGNRYYKEKQVKSGARERRWVIYKGKPEASEVPPEWQGWLTHTLAGPPTEVPPVDHDWQKPHVANMTGTEAAYRPPGAFEQGGRRSGATGDYEPWEP